MLPWLGARIVHRDRKSTRLNSSHDQISYAVFCLKKKNNPHRAAGACSHCQCWRLQVLPHPHAPLADEALVRTLCYGGTSRDTTFRPAAASFLTAISTTPRTA